MAWGQAAIRLLQWTCWTVLVGSGVVVALRYGEVYGEALLCRPNLRTWVHNGAGSPISVGMAYGGTTLAERVIVDEATEFDLGYWTRGTLFSITVRRGTDDGREARSFRPYPPGDEYCLFDIYVGAQSLVITPVRCVESVESDPPCRPM